MKQVGKICGYIQNILFVLVCVVLVSVIILRASGMQFLTVLSGSMEPVLPVGSVVIVSPKPDYETIQVGDAVTYYAGSNRDVVVTHQVIEKIEDSRQIITKGTANEVADAPVPYDAVIGTVLFDIPLIGYLMSFLATLKGKIIAGIAIASCLLISFFVSSLND